MSNFRQYYIKTDYKEAKYRCNETDEKVTEFFGILFLGIAWSLIAIEIIKQVSI